MKMAKGQSSNEKLNNGLLTSQEMSQARLLKSNFEFSKSVNGDYPSEYRGLEKGSSEAYKDFDARYYHQLKKNLEL